MIPNAFIETETLNSLAVNMSKINNSCKLSTLILLQFNGRLESERVNNYLRRINYERYQI